MGFAQMGGGAPTALCLGVTGISPQGAQWRSAQGGDTGCSSVTVLESRSCSICMLEDQAPTLILQYGFYTLFGGFELYLRESSWQ